MIYRMKSLIRVLNRNHSNASLSFGLERKEGLRAPVGIINVSIANS